MKTDTFMLLCLIVMGMIHYFEHGKEIRRLNSQIASMWLWMMNAEHRENGKYKEEESNGL